MSKTMQYLVITISDMPFCKERPFALLRVTYNINVILSPSLKDEESQFLHLFA